MSKGRKVTFSKKLLLLLTDPTTGATLETSLQQLADKSRKRGAIKILARNVYVLMVVRGIATLAELGKQTGCDASHLSRILNGKAKNADPAVYISLALALGIQSTALFDNGLFDNVREVLRPYEIVNANTT